MGLVIQTYPDPHGVIRTSIKEVKLHAVGHLIPLVKDDPPTNANLIIPNIKAVYSSGDRRSIDLDQPTKNISSHITSSSELLLSHDPDSLEILHVWNEIIELTLQISFFTQRLSL
ncbi:hypothetical protein ACFFRR_006880 [Megaselia abdita]